MRSVRTGPVVGLLAQLALLAAVAGAVGMSGFGWLVGVTCGVVTNTVLGISLARCGRDALAPADRVTLTRAALVGGVAALTADSISRPAPVRLLVALAVLALLLDTVDGWLARRTGTASTFGARFDMEVDAWLILVLSVYVARSVGAWVIAIGAARYAFIAGGWLMPWLRGSLPPRYWCKVVAAVQGVVLTVAAADVLPRSATDIALAVALALLVESFAREVWSLWRHRSVEPGRALASGPTATTSTTGGNRGIVRTVAGGLTTVLASLLVWFALVAPNNISLLTPSAFVRLPVEGIVLAALAVVLPVWPRRIVAALAGVALGTLTILKFLDMAFLEALDRPFNPVTDRGSLGPATGVVRDSIGGAWTTASVVAVAVVFVAVLVFTPLSVMRLTRVIARRRTGSARTAAGLGVVWVLCATFGLQIAPDAPVASTSATRLAYAQVGEVRAGIADERTFATALAHDPLSHAPAGDLLTGLRGKDVIVAFVESYGRVAVQDSAFSPQLDAVLDSGTSRLRAAGFSSRSAFLTSPTFGGISWLAHSTLQSGLWIDNQQRYDNLVSTNRFTLSGAFKSAGWRTVADVPSNREDWPQGASFYHYDTIYDERNVGYRGPRFSYARIPDQYTLAAFQRLELAKTHRDPVMAEIDLVSSHTPWAPLPHMVAWSKVGDGSIFDAMPAQGASATDVWRDPNLVRAAYGESIQYSLNTLISFVQTYADNNLVLILLGDHEPATIVTGDDASHDVPITIIAHDPDVLQQISGWGWRDGMLPDPHAPVWPMSAFRDRFLTAYGRQPVTPPSRLASSAPH